jgi:hypothetical protein
VSDANLAHLLDRAGLVEQRVRALVLERRAGDPAPDDPFRGLYLSDETIDRLLAGRESDWSPDADSRERWQAVEARADQQEAAGAVLRLRRLARSAGLSDLDVDLLVIALLPDLDGRFERLYAYLNDDVTRRRASVGIALQLAGHSPMAAAARGRLEPSRPLLDQNLVQVEDADRPLLTRALRVPDRVAAHLLGDDAADPSVATLLDQVAPWPGPVAEQLAHGLASGVRFVYLHERVAGTGTAIAAAALGLVGRGVVAVDLHRLSTGPESSTLVAAAVREALLGGSGLVVGSVGPAGETPGEVLLHLERASVPVLLAGTATWDPQWSTAAPLVIEAPAPGGRERLALWHRELGERAAAFDAADLAGHLALGPTQIRRAVQAAEASARLAGGDLTPDDLRRGVRAQNAAGLERLARRIEPEVGWDDLVLAPAVSRGLREVAARARHRDTVLTDWRMRRGGGRGHGVTALFAGDSGTGKTMSAEVIATDLRLDLYTVNLATVVDKYVGETEKNLERIFAEAAGVNAVLFFDEADAIFGKRSDVRDAHDRYANIESAYLLQRLETFDGLAVLATNLRANIDDAFTRRLDAIIDFPAPTPDLRRTLWAHCLTDPLPVGPDVDLDFLATSFDFAGGNIRSATTTAAYLAAAAGTPVSMAHLVAAVEQEYRKLGRLVLEREFGTYYSLIG